MIENIRNLNDICYNSRYGIYKRWVLKDKDDHSKLCDYMQKINYCIQDLNSEIPELNDPSMRSIVYTIVLLVWIKEAVERIEDLYQIPIKKSFKYPRIKEIRKANDFVMAIRSFAVAHPLSTTDFKKFGFDGNYICVDIRNFKKYRSSSFIKPDYIYQLDQEGLHQNGNRDCDFYFYVYSDKDDKMRLFRYIGCNFEEIYSIANLYIDKLYALDKYLRNQKKSDYR